MGVLMMFVQNRRQSAYVAILVMNPHHILLYLENQMPRQKHQ